MTQPKRIEPWEQLPGVWRTKAEYFQWLRGQLRKAWSRHPIKVQFRRSVRIRAPIGVKIDSRTGKHAMVWAHICVCCGGTFRDADVEVDHKVAAGSFRDWDECQQWLMGLMQVSFASLQMLCKPCHRIKSYADQHGYTFAEAEAHKSFIQWNKDTSIKEQQSLLRGEGYTLVSNTGSRRASYVHLYLLS